MIQREAEVKNKVTAVALTDSVHNVWHQEVGKSIREWMREVRLVFFKRVGVYTSVYGSINMSLSADLFYFFRV